VAVAGAAGLIVTGSRPVAWCRSGSDGLDEHADVIREAVKTIAAEMMELEVSE